MNTRKTGRCYAVGGTKRSSGFRVWRDPISTFEQRAQSEGLSGFTITERADKAANCKMRRAREVLLPSFYTLGMSGNAPVLGIDLR